MAKIPDLLTMLKSGVHFGHQLSKRNPKMEPYIFMQKNGFHIINLEETQRKLQQALDYVAQVASNGGTILFLGTKKQVKDIVKKAATESGMPYINERWLGGTFTNFASVSKLAKKYSRLVDERDTGKLEEKYTKKERFGIAKEIKKLEISVGGIVGMNKIPDAVIVCDIRKDKTAVSEAGKMKVPVIALCDTNVNPEKVAYPIPANDDSVKSVDLIVNLLAEAIKEGKAKAKPTA